MPATAGFNHLALLTADLDRFVGFYTDAFGAVLMAELTEGGMRHAMLDLGGGAALHAFEQRDNPHATATAPIFGRGHLDHFALNIADDDMFEAVRRRLVTMGASDGTVTDFGRVRSVSFVDPDGCDAEIARWQDGPVLTFDERIRTAYAPA